MQLINATLDVYARIFSSILQQDHNKNRPLLDQVPESERSEVRTRLQELRQMMDSLKRNLGHLNVDREDIMGKLNKIKVSGVTPASRVGARLPGGANCSVSAGGRPHGSEESSGSVQGGLPGRLCDRPPLWPRPLSLHCLNKRSRCSLNVWSKFCLFYLSLSKVQVSRFSHVSTYLWNIYTVISQRSLSTSSNLTYLFYN